MTHISIQLLCLLGFGALAVAMDRHQTSVFGRRLTAPRTRVVRAAGWAALALAAFAAVRAQGWSLGLVSLSGHTSLAAGLIIAWLIAYERMSASR